MKTTLYANHSGLKHDTGLDHPENADRLRAVLEVMESAPFDALPRGEIRSATEDDILRAHPYSYFEHVMENMPDRGNAMFDADTIVSPGSWHAALEAAGTLCSAIDDIANGKTQRAFCAVRPPGHHAEPSKSMGFCLFNNVFIGARYAQEIHGFRKIAIVDFDVHHGNGTDVMTRRHDGSILFISTHQYPLWPMTGLEEDNEECVMNFTLPPASGSETFRTIYEKKVFPALTRFAPDLLLLSSGFDAHKDDPLAQINLETEDFGWVTEQLCAIADQTAQGRVASILEGGYDLEALKASVSAHLAALAAD
ncbi:MAG: acetoin utilization protein [Micavibrio aeruginosavorus]|uniref:Acetoin utilization protein n=1 Tax=Micavibrio aeruginosavorus TaxID=349221 RepID=A0A2W5A083_9BACT|nr:MAG: acetoin utilization protein [Micavibrio aeruginosavorus]